jgi:hypothetical protein
VPTSAPPRFGLAVLLVATIVGVVALYFSVVAMGGGHGGYLPAKLLFPLPMASVLFTSVISPFAVVAAFLQFPAYGVCLFLGIQARRTVGVAITLVIFHVVSAALCLLLLRGGDFPSFPP